MIHVRMCTQLGDVVLALDDRAAPTTTANFMRYVRAKLYQGAKLYRVMRPEHWTAGREMELVQGGLAFQPDRILSPVSHESPLQTGLFHRAGTISMARGAPGTASSEFFICLNDCSMLDPSASATPPNDGLGFAAFGHVLDGIEVLRRIQILPTLTEAPLPLLNGQMLAKPVHIDAIDCIDEGADGSP